jgi:hypothetical protein
VVHLQENGFEVTTHEVADLAPVKAEHAVPRQLEGCHTAIVDGYVVEGHVPADVIERMLEERPDVVGIAVPGMPIGSPGMETPGRPAERYNVVTFDEDGNITVYARR